MTSIADILGNDGAAGQPSMLRHLTGRLDDNAHSTQGLANALQAIESANWHGDARSKYDQLRDATAQQHVVQIAQNYDAASHVMGQYRAQLDEIQHEAAELARQMSQQQHDLEGLRHKARTADLEETAARVVDVVTTVAPLPHVAAHEVHKAAQRAQQHAHAQVTAANERMNGLVQRGHELNDRLNAAAAACTAGLEPLVPHNGAADIPGGAHFHAVGAVGAAATIAAVARRRVKIPRDGIARAGVHFQAVQDWNATKPVRQGPLSVRNQSIADEARKRSGTGDECMVFAESVLATASNTAFQGFDDRAQFYHPGSFNNADNYQLYWQLQQHAVEVSLADAQPGDIVQWAAPNAPNSFHVHTAVLTGSGPGATLVDSNWGKPGHQIHSGTFADRDAYMEGQGAHYRIWRMGSV